jgi:hypothetical protein
MSVIFGTAKEKLETTKLKQIRAPQYQGIYLPKLFLGGPNASTRD